MIKKILNVISTVIFVLILILTAVMFLARARGEAPKLFGYRFLRVVTDSMEPEIMVGDVVICKEAEPHTLKRGDTITYRSQAPGTAGRLITHKIVEDPVLLNDGSYRFQTQGIKPGAIPDKPISQDQVVGLVTGKSGIITAVYGLFSTKAGLLIFLLPVLLIIGSEVKTIIRTLKGSDKDAEGRPEEAERNKEADGDSA